MKVIHLISGGDTGGAKTHVHSLLRGLEGHVERTLVCFMEGPFAQEARDLGIPTVVIEQSLPRTLGTLKKMIRDDGYDIIHCHGSRANLIGALLRRPTGLPVVTTVHSDYKLDYMGRLLSRLTYGTLNTIALRKLDYHIGVSDALTDQLISRGFDPDRLFTMYNGLDFSPRPVAMERAAFFRSVGLEADENSVVLGIAARLSPVKDISTLIRAFARARSQRPELRLIIAGDGDQKEELQRLAAQLGVAETVCFAGWLTDVDSFYHAIDVNTLTSVTEGSPYSLIEGARAALPTVASRVGGVPYVIDHGVTGLLFEAGDTDALANHLVTLAADRDLREQLGRRLYEKSKAAYSIEAVVEQQTEIYRTVLRKQERSKVRRDGVLVCGAYGRSNAGDDAILEAVITELRQIDRDMPIWVMSRSPRTTRMTYRVNSIYIFSVLKFLRCLGKTRLYINGGGSLMQDATSRRSLWFYLFTIRWAKRRGNKVLMYGCGIGPIRYPANRRLTARVLQDSVDAITLREPYSKLELDNMGITRPEILCSADPTVILPAAAPEAVDGLMERLGLDPCGKYICFTLRPWPGFRAKASLFGALADYAWEKYGLTSVFLPIEPRLDAGAAHTAAAHIKKAPYHITEAAGSSALAIGLLSRMQVVVSMRLHALIFAAGQGVPLVGVAYDQKVSSFLDYIGQDLYCGLAEATEGALFAHLDAACARIGDSRFLNEALERLRRVESVNSQTARKLLGGDLS